MPGRMVEPARFAMVPRVGVARSAFDTLSGHKTTFDAGYLIPVFVEEVLPGDSHRVRMTAVARLATPLVPLMDDLILESFFFFVPNRLVWSNWRRFMGEQASPSDSTQFLVPQVPLTQIQTAPGSRADYFGIATQANNVVNVNALPFRSYNLIWNEWFRDEDLQTLQPVPLDDGPDDPIADNYVDVFRRGKRPDYFTTCRPWPKKPSQFQDFGGPLTEDGGGMTWPFAGAPVMGIGVPSGQTPTASGGQLRHVSGGRDVNFVSEYSSGAVPLLLATQGSAQDAYPNVRVLINDIRTAEAIAVLMERNARGGTRYTEILRSQFGVTPQDARLQRPEYLGGGRSYVAINPIAQTSASGVAGTTTVLGELAATGTVLARDHGFSASFAEHGFIIGLVNVRAPLTYQQGLHRSWSRRGRYDYFWPPLAGLGEQAVLRKEIYLDGTAGDDAVFGYQARYDEYRFRESRVSGLFRSSASTPLDMWHLAEKFTSAPSLNATFIVSTPPVDRVLQVQGGGPDTAHFLFDAQFDVRSVRPLPMFGIPGLGLRL